MIDIVFKIKNDYRWKYVISTIAILILCVVGALCGEWGHSVYTLRTDTLTQTMLVVFSVLTPVLLFALGFSGHRNMYFLFYVAIKNQRDQLVKERNEATIRLAKECSNKSLSDIIRIANETLEPYNLKIKEFDDKYSIMLVKSISAGIAIKWCAILITILFVIYLLLDVYSFGFGCQKFELLQNIFVSFSVLEIIPIVWILGCGISDLSMAEVYVKEYNFSAHQ